MDNALHLPREELLPVLALTLALGGVSLLRLMNHSRIHVFLFPSKEATGQWWQLKT